VYGIRLEDMYTGRESIRHVAVCVWYLPSDCALARELNGDDIEWDLTNQLLAAQVDVLAIANWQRAGGKRKDKPKPVERPGMRPDRTTYGGSKDDALPLDQMADWLGWDSWPSKN